MPDGRLPTEHQLCEGHGISRKPVTWALSELAAEGVVIRHRRRGTFVNPHWLHGHRGGPELRVIAPDGCRSSPPPASWPRWRSLLALLASNGAAVLEDGLVAWDAGLGGASGG